jgi:hypothetical protein
MTPFLKDDIKRSKNLIQQGREQVLIPLLLVALAYLFFKCFAKLWTA